MNATDKVGKLVAIREVTEQDDLMIITRNGIAIRMSVLDIRQAGRNTQGVKLIRLNNSDEITSVTRILKDPDEKAAEELDEDGNVIVKEIGEATDSLIIRGEDAEEIEDEIVDSIEDEDVEEDDAENDDSETPEA